MVLANRCASGADAPPWARFIALHPGKGIALVDIDSPDAAVAPLEDFLSRAGVPEPHAGALPIVPVAVDGREARTMAERLDAVLPPMHGELDNPSWSKSAVQLLLSAPDLTLTRVRRVAPVPEVTRAEPSNYPRHAVEAWHVLLARSGMRQPDSALLDWSPPHGWRSLATVAALLVLTVGARAIQEYGPSRFQPVMTPQSAAAEQATDTLARAMILPAPLAAIAVATTALPTLEKLSPVPSLDTLTPSRQAFVPLQPTVVTPQPKPATPAGFTDTNHRQRASPQPKAASKPAAPNHFKVAGDPAAKQGGLIDPAWYDRGAKTPSNAGLTAFVAPGARNADLIPANLRTAQLASGTTATLDFYGDGLVNIAVNGKALARAIDPSTGKPLGAAVGNTRMLKAASGNVFVTANVAANVVDDVVNTAGIVQASSASEQNGQIVLNGDPGGSGGTVQAAVTKNPSADPNGGTSAVGGGAPEDQGVVYATTAVTVAQDATGVSAITTNVGKTVAAVPTTVTHVGTAGSTLTNTVNALTKPVTSLALPGR